MTILHKKIKLAYEGTIRKEKITIHLRHLNLAITEAEKKLIKLQAILAKEQLEFEQLQTKSVRKVFHKVLGTEDQKLEKEKQEFLAAFMEYQGFKKHLELMQFEKTVLEKQSRGLHNIEQQLERLIERKEKNLLADNTKSAVQLIAVDQKKLAYKGLISEIQEARSAGRACLRILEKIDQQLKEVENWGQPNGTGKNAKRRPTRWIDRATKNAHKANNLLQKFENQLLDIFDHHQLDYKPHILTLQGFLKHFVDQLIVDWVIQKKINHTIHGITSVHDRISMILMMLETEIKDTKILIKKADQERKQIIIKSI